MEREVIMCSKSVLAWHFLSANRRLGYDDRRLVRKGQTLRIKGEPILCEHGLHGSLRLIDALSYASGPIIERVEIGVDEPYEIIEDDNKLVGTWRKTLWWIDATTILHEFACREAEKVLEMAGVTDKRCWDAIRVKRLWLQGKVTDKKLDEARVAAWVAVRAAATATEATAVAAATTARAAEEVVANIAYKTAMLVTSYVAVFAASQNEVRNWQNRRLIAMVCAAHRKMGR